uniref:Altered inheritance of mitochondria protein 32 n=1 Tax=Noccaea caerulescens TaxID=107243 RepID=A0A1J3H8N0_NOCCA
MANVENLSSVPASEDTEFGFKRPEMYSADIANSINSYGRHVFVLYKTPEAWLSHIEEEGLPQRFATLLKDRKSDLPVQTKLNVCEGGGSDGDVLIFPDMVRYKGIKDTEVESFFEDVLVNEKPWRFGREEKLSGTFVFVCTHASRDKRCGVCGPVILERFKQEIGSRGLTDEISLRRCSHVGQHKYSGNIIIFSPDSAGKIFGNWYGYVTPEDVPELLDQQIAKGEIIQRIWRGQMGLPGGVPEREHGHAVIPNGNSVAEESTGGGCCQGSNGSVSCCQNENSKPEPIKKDVGKCTIWFQPLDKEEIYIGAAVVGAVATIAMIAFTIFKRSG